MNLARAREVQRLLDEARTQQIPVGDAQEMTPAEVRLLWPDWQDTELTFHAEEFTT